MKNLGEIIKILKEKNLAPEDMEHWGSGVKGDGKIYLNDDGEACKIHTGCAVQGRQ